MRLCSSLLFMFSVSASAQVITGEVYSMKPNEPLAYVHIGVVGKNMGVISREDGSYEIDLSKAEPTDVVAFSIIGYETRELSISEMKAAKRVRLAPRVYKLREVVVRSKKDQPKTEKLGRFTPTKTTQGQSGKREYGFGGEWGLKISPHGKKYFINNIQLHMRFNTVDSVLFRINMYEVVNDMPDASILNKEIFMTSKKKQKWIVRNLVKENLILDQDLIVTFEVVRVWFGTSGENQIFLTHGSGYEEGRTYFRSSSQDAWTADKYAPATLYLTVEEL